MNDQKPKTQRQHLESSGNVSYHPGSKAPIYPRTDFKGERKVYKCWQGSAHCRCNRNSLEKLTFSYTVRTGVPTFRYLTLKAGNTSIQNYNFEACSYSLIQELWNRTTFCTGQTHPSQRTPEINYLLTHLRKLEKVLERVTLKLSGRNEITNVRVRMVEGHLEQVCSNTANQTAMLRGKKTPDTGLLGVGPGWLRIACRGQGHWFDPWSGQIPHAQEHLIPSASQLLRLFSGAGGHVAME